MYRVELQKLEGVWTGTERVEDSGEGYDATGRYEFHTVFDGRFLLCDYSQSAPSKPTSIAHGVFRREDKTGQLTVTWFRSPAATPTQQSDAFAEGDKLIFVEKTDKTAIRTTYSVALNRLTITTEQSINDSEWKTTFEGSYRRPRG
jgi:hypothetical protein